MSIAKNGKTVRNGNSLPTHIGFIMDGNGRWAKKRGLPRKFGHKEGANAFKRMVRYCRDIGIKYITFYAFSTENWSRPKEEVDAIINLFEEYLNEVSKHIDEKIRLLFIGNKSSFSDNLQAKMKKLEQDSRDFDRMTLILAINYGGRDEIVNAVKEISALIKDGMISSGQIDKELISSMLYTKGVPDVDLVIRASGEQRISNFLIWQSAYAEFYFTDVLWPDFSTKDLDVALENYRLRVRKFGGVL